LSADRFDGRQAVMIFRIALFLLLSSFSAIPAQQLGPDAGLRLMNEVLDQGEKATGPGDLSQGGLNL